MHEHVTTLARGGGTQVSRSHRHQWEQEAINTCDYYRVIKRGNGCLWIVIVAKDKKSQMFTRGEERGARIDG